MTSSSSISSGVDTPPPVGGVLSFSALLILGCYGDRIKECGLGSGCGYSIPQNYIYIISYLVFYTHMAPIIYLDTTIYPGITEDLLLTAIQQSTHSD